MDIYMLTLVIMGVAFLGAAWLPRFAQGRPLSFPFVYVAAGFLLFVLPVGVNLPNPLTGSYFVERFTEILVIISLTGAGLKLSRPVGLRSWSTTWRLLAVAMPLCIAAAAFLGWWVLGLAPASAILLGAVLAPTDPVLASDVQAPAPNRGGGGEIRFALTSEAGLNDGLAFPFTYLAIAAAAASAGGGLGWLGEWALRDLVLAVIVGGVVGLVVGGLLGRMIFRMQPGPDIARTRDGFVVLSITLLPYGLAELLQGYGFLAVFVAALAVRHTEREHAYHEELHTFAEGLERILTTLMLILFGGLLAQGLLSEVSWTALLVALLFVLVVRPLAAYPSLAFGGLRRRERIGVAFFGIRGVGSLYYLAYAVNHAEFSGVGTLWGVVSLVIVVSIVVHGASASRVMRLLEGKESGGAPPGGEDAGEGEDEKDGRANVAGR